MLLELFIFFEIIAIALFLFSFFSKHEIIWGLTLILFGLLMFSSHDIEWNGYKFNATTSAYDIVTEHYYYPYLIWVNGAFFLLALVLMIYDIFDKYGKKMADEIDDSGGTKVPKQYKE